ncbi:hypothetical protein [Noviherbaspirillum saxi]|uniref:hypothetical protein n=1 Tax=Noviherbaspirillum saxi TaxID=2320863 RepID=UPI001313F4DE|nr:hypothetical protein [Noviherbaspirillum saxi]
MRGKFIIYGLIVSLTCTIVSWNKLLSGSSVWSNTGSGSSWSSSSGSWSGGSGGHK